MADRNTLTEDLGKRVIGMTAAIDPDPTRRGRFKVAMEFRHVDDTYTKRTEPADNPGRAAMLAADEAALHPNLNFLMIFYNHE